MRDLPGIILAGCLGERLKQLTQARARPAVPFGGKYHIAYSVENNFIKSGIQNV